MPNRKPTRFAAYVPTDNPLVILAVVQDLSVGNLYAQIHGFTTFSTPHELNQLLIIILPRTD